MVGKLVTDLSNINEKSKETYDKADQLSIKLSPYYLNNREFFINSMNRLFSQFNDDEEEKMAEGEDKMKVLCDKYSSESDEFTLMKHQEIVRMYIQLYSPYRGLLLYHGLGSGKTCTSLVMGHAHQFLRDRRKDDGPNIYIVVPTGDLNIIYDIFNLRKVIIIRINEYGSYRSLLIIT